MSSLLGTEEPLRPSLQSSGNWKRLDASICRNCLPVGPVDQIGRVLEKQAAPAVPVNWSVIAPEGAVILTWGRVV
jgi:hypothetical protein